MPTTMLRRVVAEGRDYEIRQIAQFFDYDHLPPDLQVISEPFHDTATLMVRELPDSPQLLQGLWDLLRAKDCFVRAAVAARPDADAPRVVRCSLDGGHQGHPWHEGNPHNALYQIPPEDADRVWCRGEPIGI